MAPTSHCPTFPNATWSVYSPAGSLPSVFLIYLLQQEVASHPEARQAVGQRICLGENHDQCEPRFHQIPRWLKFLKQPGVNLSVRE